MHDHMPHPDVLEKLRNNHARLREELTALSAAVKAISDDHDDPEALGSIRRSVGYFDRSVARHEADEEESLFPRIAHLPEIASVLAVLDAEHVVQRGLHASLKALIPADGTPDRGAIGRIGEAVRALIESYDAHLAREERELFPVAARALDPEAHTLIAHEMDERRGRGGGGGGGGGGGRRQG